MHRRAEHKTVRRFCFLNKFIDRIVHKAASVLKTDIAADAAGDRLCTHLKNLGLNAVLLESPCHLAERCISTSLFPRTSVYQYYFHVLSSILADFLPSILCHFPCDRTLMKYKVLPALGGSESLH